MKKVLFATTALIATAGVAAEAAEVNFSGYGRFGIGYVEDRTGDVDTVAVVTDADVTAETAEGVDTDDTILVSRFRLNIDGIVETDGGVRFEGRVRLQADEDAGNGEANSAGLNGARFSVIYGGLRVDAGNVAGAFDNGINYYGTEVGLELFAGQYSGVDYSFLGYSSTGSGANAVYVNYSVGDFSFGASYDQRTFAETAADGSDTVDADRWDIGAAYTFNNFSAEIIYGQTKSVGDLDKQSLTVLALGAEFGDFSGTLFVADDDVAAESRNGTAYGLSAAYNLGTATTLQFVYGDGSADDDLRQIAVGAIYDLGGGASLRGGIGTNKRGDGESVTQADFGAQFNF
ncbi:outer membrane protein OmpU [Ruegeria halocynthiae]|uniref:Outer membrane protein OmpU n=1 Tax=Ruegeria halocynthiae TaxID=985054 RepID=A0A1H3C1Z5_9RHOB|nr:porin [Ruegeria halocynthiae]SDX47529.1 outer membrane protein OmpU [Ruegeria halocynthiae]